MTAEKPNQENIKPDIEFENPEWLLYIIVTMLLWVFGFVDLINETSDKSQTVMGRYSIPYFSFLVLYALTFFTFFAFLRQKNIERLKKAIAWIQKRPLISLGLAFFLVSAFALASEYDRFTKYSVFQMTVLAHLLLVFSILVFSHPDPGVKRQSWRRIVVIPLAVLIAGELILQVLSFARLLPANVQHESGYFVPYGRVYQIVNDQVINTTMNRYGWHYPDFRENPELFNVALIGDSYLQGIQVRPEENLGAALDGLLNAGDVESGNSEVMAFGMPGFGPGTYRTLVDYSIAVFAPDEIIVFLNLGNDFQNSSKPADRYFFYYVDEEERKLRLEGSSYTSWHDSQHLTFRAHEPFFLWQTIKSHLLTPTVVQSLFSAQDAVAQAAVDPLSTTQIEGSVWRKSRPWVPHHNSDWDIVFQTTRENSFFFTENGGNDTQNGIAMTRELLLDMQRMATEAGKTMRVVTIPVFPPAFYAQGDNGEWTPIVGEYDLFYGEQEMAAFAREAGIPFLSSGEAFQNSDLTAAEIEGLYIADESTYLSVAGHAYLAQLVYDCFYGEGTPGCYNP